MSAVDLFLLGLLKDRSWNAYELARFVKGNDIDRMVKISRPAIYRNLKRLAEASYLSRETKREGNRPEKVVYSITDEGLRYFRVLLTDVARQPVAFYLDLNCVLINLPAVSPEEGAVLIAAMRDSLDRRSALLDAAQEEHRGFHWVVQSIIRQQALLNEQLRRWLADFERDYASSREGGDAEAG